MTDTPQEKAPPLRMPASLAEHVAGMSWIRDQVGQAGSIVHRLQGPDCPTLYLKHGSDAVAEDITAEFVRMRWLGQRVSTPVVESFVLQAEEAWLLMSAVPGQSAHDELTAYPDQRFEIVTGLADQLRRLHSLEVDECPFNSAHPLRLAEAQRRLHLGEVDASDFDEARQGLSPEQVWAEMTSLLPLETERVATHGDYSLDNILIDQGRVSGVIDLGRVGTANRYQDLAILWNSLGEFGADLQAHMWEAYGIAEPDERLLDFHLMLDEFF